MGLQVPTGDNWAQPNIPDKWHALPRDFRVLHLPVSSHVCTVLVPSDCYASCWGACYRTAQAAALQAARGTQMQPLLQGRLQAARPDPLLSPASRASAACSLPRTRGCVSVLKRPPFCPSLLRGRIPPPEPPSADPLPAAPAAPGASHSVVRTQIWRSPPCSPQHPTGSVLLWAHPPESSTPAGRARGGPSTSCPTPSAPPLQCCPTELLIRGKHHHGHHLLIVAAVPGNGAPHVY